MSGFGRQSSAGPTDKIDEIDELAPLFRKFDNATLDADLTRLRAYYAFNESEGNFENSAPWGDGGSMASDRLTYLIYGAPGAGGGGVRIPYVKYYTEIYLRGWLPRLGGLQSMFTINFWIEIPDTTPPETSTILSFDRNTSNPNLSIWLDTGGHLYIYAQGGTQLVGTTVLNNNTRYMITLRRSPNPGATIYYPMLWHLYINSVEEGTSTGAAHTFDPSEMDFLQIGKWNYIKRWPNNAIISALSVWDTDLSTAQIAALYNSGTGRFLQGAGL